MTSADGLTWNQVPISASGTPSAQSWSNVTFGYDEQGNGLFVAVANGTAGIVATSPDGLNWTEHPAANTLPMRSVTFGQDDQGKGLFVAVGHNSSSANLNDSNRVMTSRDGINWTARTAAANNSWFSVTYGNGLFVAVSSDGANRVMTSPDGINWTARTAAANNLWLSVAYGNGLFVAVASTGVGNRVMISGNVCGPGLALPTSPTALWQQLALPCVPTTPTVQGALGSGATGNLLAAGYDSTWVVYQYDAGANAYAKRGLADAVAPGTGYWLKSENPPEGGGALTVTGTATTAEVTGAACAVAAGCKAVSLVVAADRYNLVGNPFPYHVDWAKVRIRVDGTTVYTPSEADTNNVLSKQIWIWNGTNYDTWDDVTTIGNLKYFQSFWVKVLPGAVGHTLELLIPAEASTHGRLEADPARALTAAPLPWYLGWLDWVAAPAQAAEGDWQVRLTVTNQVTGWQDTTNLLGQKSTAQSGYDRHDLLGMAPFATPYLSLVFPHRDWPALNGQPRAGDYDTDFRPQSTQATNWNFELRGSPATGGRVFITWQGDPALLKRSRLVDLQTGAVIDPTAARYAQGYPVALKTSPQRYQWRYLGR